MIKISKLATPIKDDVGAKLGALVGAITGIILSYWGATALSHPEGTIAVLAVSAGLFLGLIIGFAVGFKIDNWCRMH